MKKFLLSTAILLLILAVVSGQAFAANRLVSINFAQNTNQVFTGGQLIGPYATDSSYWNNSGANIPSGTMLNLIDSEGVATGIDVVWSSANCWYNSDGTVDDEHKLAVGYLDDGSGVTITLSNIPYANYKIVGLYSSDQGDTATVNFDVNGTWALGGDDSTTADAYGSINSCNTNTGSYWTQIEQGVTRGNYWTVDATGETCTITGELKKGTSRGSLAGIIIETDEPALKRQRSISTNFQWDGGPDGWGYHWYLSRSSNPKAGFVDPNGVIPVQQIPTSTWNEGTFITETYKAKDETGNLGSAIAMHSGDFKWGTSWYVNIDSYFAGTIIEAVGGSELEDAKNKRRVATGFIGHYGSNPKKPLTTMKKVPYSDYMVVAYMHPDRLDVQQELQIEDQSFFYLCEHGDDPFSENLKSDPNDGGWLVATETTGPATKRANVAIFRHLSDKDMVMILDTTDNTGVSAYSIISEVDPEDIVTQVLPGNSDKDYGDAPASVTTDLTWNAPVNGADSYDVYLGLYGDDDPNLYLVEAGNTTGSYTPTLAYNKSYVWKVDTVRGGETISGDYFYFDVEGDPLLQVQPGSVSVEAGSDTSFTVGALMTDNYQWFYSVDDVIGDDTEVQSGPDATLDVTNVTEGVNTGYYYVVLTNNIPGSSAVTSDLVSLEIGQLELYLPFDGDPNDASGNDWLIVPGNRIVDVNGIITPSMGEISYQTGYDGINQAAKFTRGTGDQLEVLDSDDYFNFYNKGFTVRFWVKPTYGVGGYLTYMGKSSNTWNPGSSGWRMFDEGEYAGQGYSANMSPLTYNTPVGRLDDGNWHMVACTYDRATREMKVYQNGVLQGTLTDLLGPITSYPLVIGNQYKDGTGGWGYEGLIDELEIFSYAVSEYDMLNDFATKTGLELCFGDIEGDVNDDCKVDMQDLSVLAPEWLETTNPDTPPMTRVVNWQFDEISGMTAADSSGNGIDGTLGAGFADDADAQWIIDGGRTGMTGDNALFFNGDPNTWVIADANSITVPFANGADDIFEGTASWTINLWIKFASEYAASEMVNIGGFGYNEWPGDPDPDGNSDRYFASYAGGYEFEVGQDGLWPSNPLGADWTMMTATYDGTTCTVYYNGQQVSQMDVVLVDAIEEINLNTARRVLWDYEGITVPMNATVDDFSIWSEAFGAAQILGMYENSFPSCDGMLFGDINGDCDVNMDDFLLLVSTWLECNRIPESLCY